MTSLAPTILLQAGSRVGMLGPLRTWLARSARVVQFPACRRLLMFWHMPRRRD